MNEETKIELSIVEQYIRDEAKRRAEMWRWIADSMEEAFSCSQFSMSPSHSS
jgi:hypothetical protein